MRIRPLLSLTALLVFSAPAFGHGGGLDDRGCHTESATGEYHCHQGPMAGQSFASKAQARSGGSADKAEPRESPREYDRELYGDWIDADGDCQDTREEVLIVFGAEIELGPQGCEVESGRWAGPYTGQTFTDPGDLHIDHIVPLKEAHVSGAAGWPQERKERFANSRANLLPVEAGANMSKGSRDPAEWMPERGRCQYIGQWVKLKEAWGLDMDRAEQRAVERHQQECR